MLLMSLIRDKESGRLHLKSKLMGESLMRKEVLEDLDYQEPHRLFPDVTVFKIGGQSITDMGAKAIVPIIEEIAANRHDHKMMIASGGGTRSRHAYSIALELRMPTGVIAKLGQTVSEQNALMLSVLLSPYGGIKVIQDDIAKFGNYFAQGCIPVVQGMPPYGFFEHLPDIGVLPQSRTDLGTYLLAEVMGAKQCVYIKDVNGLYTDNPKADPDAKFIPRVGAQELLDMELNDLVVEKVVIESLLKAKTIKEIQVINGLKEGNITKALHGEHVGTIIYKDNE